MELQKTAMQQLIDKIKFALENHDLAKTQYGNGYKQCLISMQNDIEMQMLSIEKEQIINAVEWNYKSNMGEVYYKSKFKNN